MASDLYHRDGPSSHILTHSSRRCQEPLRKVTQIKLVVSHCKQKQSVTNILTSLAWKWAWDLREQLKCRKFMGIRNKPWARQPCSTANFAEGTKKEKENHIFSAVLVKYQFLSTYACKQCKSKAYEKKLARAILVWRCTEGNQSLLCGDKAAPNSLCWAKQLKLTDFLEQLAEWGLGHYI